MKQSISVTIGMILSVYLHSFGVSANYELIASQKDIRVATFSSNVKNTYLENPNRQNAYTFTNIGNLNPSDFVDDDGYYQFKLIYLNLHDYDETNPVDNDLSVTLEWKQTSWLTATSIAGYTPINVPPQSAPGDASWASDLDCWMFEGLALSDRDESFLDGNGNKVCWFNSVGAISGWRDIGGIPAFNGQAAFAAALYVYNPTPDYCSILDIDAYLLQCSNEFPALKTEVESINTRIYVFGNSAKASSSMQFIENDKNGKNGNSWIESIGLNGKDIIIISLLLINFIGMIYSHYRIHSKENRNCDGKKYAVQFDEEMIDKPINK